MSVIIATAKAVFLTIRMTVSLLQAPFLCVQTFFQKEKTSYGKRTNIYSLYIGTVSNNCALAFVRKLECLTFRLLNYFFMRKALHEAGIILYITGTN